MAKLLLDKGYRVLGGVRRTSSGAMLRLRELGIEDEVELVNFDLFELSNMMRQLEILKPDEIYNLAAQSFVGLSFEQPIYTAEIDAIGPAKLLEAIRAAVTYLLAIYQASTSEMFGNLGDQTKGRTETLSVPAAKPLWGRQAFCALG